MGLWDNKWPFPVHCIQSPLISTHSALTSAVQSADPKETGYVLR